jgi:hypothetical protein
MTSDGKNVNSKTSLVQIVAAIVGASANDINMIALSCCIMLMNIVILLPKFLQAVIDTAFIFMNKDKQVQVSILVIGLLFGFIVCYLLYFNNLI